ncbi:MAG: alpha/beta hydrolase [Candidatus Geothermincolia bacterium]
MNQIDGPVQGVPTVGAPQTPSPAQTTLTGAPSTNPAGEQDGGVPPPAYAAESFGAYRGRFDRIKPWMILLVVGVIVLALGILVTSKSTSGVSYQKVTFTTQGLEEKPVTVAGLLVKPTGPIKGKVPGVVFANGITGSKEWYVQLTRQMAKEGLVVLSIDLRGHGSSTGASEFACDEVNDVIAAGNYLKNNVPEVDPAHIIAMGHSLGGATVTRAGVVQPDNLFSSVVAIWSWTSWEDAITDLTGPLEGLTGRAWSFTSFSRNIDINSAADQRDRDMVAVVSDTKPPNYMLAIGSADELASVAREEELMEKATAAARRSGPEPKLKEGVTYGDFSAGTARKLVVTNDDHVAELASGAILRPAIDWIKQGAGLPVTAGQSAPFLWGRYLGFILIAIGIMLLILGLLSLVRRKLFPEGGEIVVTPPWEYPAGRQVLDILIYALPLLAASFLAMPAAKALGIKPFVPYAGVNEFSIFYASRTLLLLPFFIALVVVIARRYSSAGRLEDQVKKGAGRWAKSAAYGLIPVAVAVFVLLVIGGPLLLPKAFAKLPMYFFLGVACVAAAFWMEDYLFYKLAYHVLESGDDQKKWKVLLVRAVVLDLALIAAMLPLMKGLGVSIKLMAFRVPVIMLLLFTTVAFIGVAWVSLRLRSLTGGSLSFALMFTAIAVWFLTAPIGTRGF